MAYLILTLGLLWTGVLPAMAEETTVTVTGTGYIFQGDTAAARDRAIEDARVRAVEQVCGTMVDARSVLHKELLIDDTVMTRTSGMVKQYHVLKEGPGDYGLYRVTLEAVVDQATMSNELTRLAGEKNLLVIRRSPRDKGQTEPDAALVRELAKTFGQAGFHLSLVFFKGADFDILDQNRIEALAQRGNRDIIITLALDSDQPECRVKNFCAATATGFVRMYSGHPMTLMIDEETTNVKGFGNRATAATADARQKCAENLVTAMMDQLDKSRVRELKVAIKNIPDYDAYRALKHRLAAFRWVKDVADDTVGYHPVKSVFIVRFARNPDLLSGMLDKIGGYRFLGRNNDVFTLEAINGEGSTP